MLNNNMDNTNKTADKELETLIDMINQNNAYSDFRLALEMSLINVREYLSSKGDDLDEEAKKHNANVASVNSEETEAETIVKYSGEHYQLGKKSVQRCKRIKKKSVKKNFTNFYGLNRNRMDFRPGETDFSLDRAERNQKLRKSYRIEDISLKAQYIGTVDADLEEELYENLYEDAEISEISESDDSILIQAKNLFENLVEAIESYVDGNQRRLVELMKIFE